MDDNKLVDSIEWLTSRRRFLTVAGGAAAAGLATSSVAAQDGSDDGDDDGDESGTGDQEDSGPQPFTAIEFSNQTSDGTEIVIDAVTLSDGGYVAIHDVRLFDGQVAESVIGVSEYLEPGAHYSVEVSLFDVPGGEFEREQLEGTTPLVPMPHMETNGNETYDFVTSDGMEDGPYAESGIPAVDAGFVTADSQQSTDDEQDTEGDECDNGDGSSDSGQGDEGDDGEDGADDGEDSADDEEDGADDDGEDGSDDDGEDGADDGEDSADDGEDSADDGEDSADDDGEDEEGPTPFATIEFQNQSVDEGTVTVREVTLSEGGFVTLHDARLLAGEVLESVVGVSEYLEAGRHQSVEVTVDEPTDIAEVQLPARPLLPMPHQDTNDNQAYDFVDSEGADDGPYTKAQQAVVDAGLVTVTVNE